MYLMNFVSLIPFLSLAKLSPADLLGIRLLSDSSSLSVLTLHLAKRRIKPNHLFHHYTCMISNIPPGLHKISTTKQNTNMYDIYNYPTYLAGS